MREIWGACDVGGDKSVNRMNTKECSITNNPVISAIYYALLQCGYDFYSVGRDELTLNKIRSFITTKYEEYDFFSEVKQDTCEVYPYWPRAAMLETATFYIDLYQACFVDFTAYKNYIQSAKNISDMERNGLFWNWIPQFPKAIKSVLQSEDFDSYLKWEDDWIAEQNEKYKNELRKIWDTFMLCKERFQSPFQDLQIVLNPIKCVYSADYHLQGNKFIFCSGALSEEAIIHEFIHHIVRPIVEKRKDEILCCNLKKLNIDTSYYLNNDELGTLNAFEEYMVRILTDLIVGGDIPKDLDMFICQKINL